MQTILSSVIFALVAGAAVDSAAIAGDKSVAKRDLWQSLAEMSGHMAGVQSYGAPTAGDWSRSGFESRMIAPDHYHGTAGTGSGSGAAAEQLRVASHPVHEWHQEEEQSSSGHEWRPYYHEEPRRHHAVSTHSKEASREEHTQEEWKDDDHEDDKHDKHTKEHHHHHHHHVKVIEVPKPYTVHVEKPYPIYVEKPVIVEKHVPLKLYIKKKVHH